MEYTEKTVKSYDETIIAYYIANENDKNKDKNIIIFNGLGGNIHIWKYLIDFFPDYRFISWDYRGTYNSQIPLNKNDLTINHHLKDFEKIIEVEGIKNGIVLGWSLGGQIALEYYRKNKDFFKAMILVGSPYKNFLKNIIDIENFYNFPKEIVSFVENFYKKVNIEQKVVQIVDIVQNFSEIYSIILKTITNVGNPSKLLKIVQFINDNTDNDFFNEIIKSYVNLNMNSYLQIAKEVNSTNCEDILPQIKIPVLFIAGTKDIFAPLKYKLKMRKMVENSNYLEIYKGSHYSFVEFPELVNIRIKKFLRENGLR